MTTTNSRFLGILTLLLVPVAVVPGCGGGGGGGLTQTEFCSQKATKECDGVAAACVSDPAACKAKRVMACEQFAAAQQASPSSALLRPFKADKASACINKAAEIYKMSPITPEGRQALDDVCARVFSGVRKDTDKDPACNNDYECDASQICDVGFKTCAKKSSVSANAGCNNPGEVCPADQFCNTATPRKCMPRLTVGMACDDDTNPCAASLRCSAGMCAERVTIGKACAADSDCATGAPYCDTFNGSICTAGFTPSTGSKECVGAFGGADTGGGTGTGGASGGGAGGAGGGN